MSRPSFGEEKEVTVCASCGDLLTIPPGIIYRDEKMHRHCADIRRRDDLGVEEIEPFFDGVEQDLEDLLENMEPRSSEDKTTEERITEAKAGG